MIDYEGERVTPEEKQEAQTRFERVKLKSKTSLIPQVKPVISGLLFDDQGNIWVRKFSRNNTYLILDNNGELLAEQKFDSRIGVIKNESAYGILRNADNIRIFKRYKLEAI